MLLITLLSLTTHYHLESVYGDNDKLSLIGVGVSESALASAFHTRNGDDLHSSCSSTSDDNAYYITVERWLAMQQIRNATIVTDGSACGRQKASKLRKKIKGGSLSRN